MKLSLPTYAPPTGLDLVRRELGEAIAARKCHGCGCFQQTVEAAESVAAVRAELAPLVAEARAKILPKQYDCLGCDPCWPAVAANALSESFPAEFPSGTSCDAEPPTERRGWPPLPGDFRVVRFRAPVAVCTLGSSRLVDEICSAAPEGLGIVGRLETENLGIERIVRNVIANPNLRFLVLCGEDSRRAVGHLPGQSLASLFAKGTDEHGRINGACGRRPVLRNVTVGEIEAFRHQVELIEAIGETDARRISALVSEAARRDPGPRSESPAASPIFEVLQGSASSRLVADPGGFVVIFVDGMRLVAEHYSIEGALDLVVEGPTAESVYGPLIGRGVVTRLDHAAYLGRELARAERAARAGERYVQDRAPGEIVDGPDSPQRGCASPREGAE